MVTVRFGLGMLVVSMLPLLWQQQDKDEDLVSANRLSIIQGLESASGVVMPTAEADIPSAGKSVKFFLFLADGCSLVLPDGYLENHLFELPDGLKLTELAVVSGKDVTPKMPGIDVPYVRNVSGKVVIEGVLSEGDVDAKGAILSCNVMLDYTGFKGTMFGTFRRRLLLIPLSPKDDWM
jgi:hypothetical protein